MLSDAARKVCAEYWRAPAGRCVGCPIERECSAPVPRGAGLLGLRTHAERVNRAAEGLTPGRLVT